MFGARTAGSRRETGAEHSRRALETGTTSLEPAAGFVRGAKKRLSHLPKKLHPSVGKTLRDAYRSKSKTTAKRRLLQLATQLSADHPDAASSLKEGLDETLSLKGVGLPDWLERTLSSTNSIENVNGRMRAILRKVKRWRDGSMIKRWVATALLETERGFRKVRGYQGMPTLVAAIRGDAEQIDRVDHDEAAA